MIFGVGRKKKKSCRFTVMIQKGSNILFILFVILLAACSKGGTAAGGDDDNGPHIISPNDVTAPVVDIYTPIANQVFTTGTTVNITGKISDDFGLYRGTVRIINDANGEVLKNQQYEIHGLLSYNFNVPYYTVVSTASNYTVTVTFEDHGLNSTTKSVSIKVNP